VKSGAKDLVLSAVKEGVSDRHAIMAHTGLTRMQVDNALTRLQADGHIVLRKRLCGYVPVTQQLCLLAEVWRRPVQPIP
jgi:hypothetical protein